MIHEREKYHFHTQWLLLLTFVIFFVHFDFLTFPTRYKDDARTSVHRQDMIIQTRQKATKMFYAFLGGLALIQNNEIENPSWEVLTRDRLYKS